MIRATFAVKDGRVTGVTVTGHSDFADYGEDIVCAGVSSAVMLTANGITEILKEQATVTIGEAKLVIMPKELSEESEKFLLALKLHLESLSKDYPKNITIMITEV